jgi:hypothetical protein
MPKTSSGRPYKLWQGEEPRFCVVCGTDNGQPTLYVGMEFDWDGEPQRYQFPVCSLVCVLAWSELFARAVEGDVEAAALAIAYCKLHDGWK